MLAHRQGDGAARAADLVGDLHARRRCTDDEHAALGELARIAVLHRGQRRDGRRHRLGVVGHPRHVERAGRDHDGRALPVALVSDDAVAVVGGAHRHDRGAGLYGRGDLLRIPGDEVDDLWHRHEAVGIVALVRVARQPALPVRREQTERIPPLRPPRVGHFLRSSTTWSIDRCARHRLIASPQWPAPRTTVSVVRTTRPRSRGAAGQTTSTLTFVGLVTTSYTAERFCDCSTIARISSGVASASMS